MSFNDDWNKGYSGQAPPSGGSALDSWQAGKATAEWNANANSSAPTVPNFGADWSQAAASRPTYSGGGGSGVTGTFVGGGTAPTSPFAVLRWAAYVPLFPVTLTSMILALAAGPVLFVMAGASRPSFGRAYRVAVSALFFYTVALFVSASLTGRAIGPAVMALLAGAVTPQWLMVGQLVGVPLATLIIARRLRTDGFGGVGGAIKALIAAAIVAAIAVAAIFAFSVYAANGGT